MPRCGSSSLHLCGTIREERTSGFPSGEEIKGGVGLSILMRCLIVDTRVAKTHAIKGHSSSGSSNIWLGHKGALIEGSLLSAVSRQSGVKELAARRGLSLRGWEGHAPAATEHINLQP